MKSGRDIYAVLRCRGPETVEVVRGLGIEGLGLRAWTPTVWVHKRRPRSKARYWVRVPVISSYFFLRLEDLPKALNLQALGEGMQGLCVSPDTGKPMFFRPQLIRGQVMVVSNQELGPLREADFPEPPTPTLPGLELPEPEGQDEPTALPPPRPPGTRVRILGVLQGVTGCVIEEDWTTGEVVVEVAGNADTNLVTKVRLSSFLTEPF